MVNDSGFLTSGDFDINPHSLKGYLDEGELLADTQGLADVTNYAHSTFDESKFTKSASWAGNITTNGIASGFSSTSYLTTPTINWSSNNFEIYFSFSTNANFSSRQSQNICGFGISTDRLSINLTSNSMGLASGNSHFTGIINIPVSANNTYNTIISVKNNTVTFRVSVNGGNYTDYTTSLTTPFANNYPFSLGNIAYSITDPFVDGSIDLKQFSITVDGVPVFVGNQTGIDTIKPDDYAAPTASGEALPTISGDGVASSFSSTQYIIIPSQNLTYQNDWEVISPVFTFGSTTSSQSVTMIGESSSRIAIAGLNNGKLLVAVQIPSSSTNILRYDNISYSANTRYQIKIKHTTSGVYSAYLKTGDGDFESMGSPVTDTSTQFNTTNLAARIGYQTDNANPFSNGTIDLNAFKIYVDGNLVYQPCLKIPYTLSKTGSKIVDVYARNRVNDMYAQFGYAPYYTLNEGVNFTVPQGEIYGIIEKRTDIDLTGKLNTDLSNITNTSKNTIVGWGLPDYSKIVSIPLTGDSYIVPFNCICYVYLDEGRNATFTVNNHTFNKTNTMMNFILNKNDIISASCATGYSVIVDLFRLNYPNSILSNGSTTANSMAGIYISEPEPD